MYDYRLFFPNARFDEPTPGLPVTPKHDGTRRVFRQPTQPRGREQREPARR
jgi:hypothetical protein